MTPPLAPFDRLPLAVRQAVDDACTRAEAGLRAGVRPDLTALVRACPAPGRAVLLVELIGLDLEYRRGADAPTVAEYLALLPDDRPVVVRAATPTGTGRTRSWSAPGSAAARGCGCSGRTGRRRPTC